jgi:hypothetical protein
VENGKTVVPLSELNQEEYPPDAKPASFDVAADATLASLDVFATETSTPKNVDQQKQSNASKTQLTYWN